MMTNLNNENDALRCSWDKYSYHQLDTYLVSDVEDPRINCQSILSRALIADSLWPNDFTNLIEADLRFGAVMTWLLAELKKGYDRYELMKSIETGASHSCPKFVRETYNWLQSEECPINDYISTALHSVNFDNPEQLLFDSAVGTFSQTWRLALRGSINRKISLLEVACGSANDYRFIDQYGLAEFVDYTGIDISEKNISNAKARFPKTDFRVASIIDSGIPDESVDYLYVHDLFEHLSAQALKRAMSEILRVVRHQAWLHFFNVKRCSAHIIRKIDRYHWNTLSLDRLCEMINDLGSMVEILPISNFLENRFRGYSHYNNGAFTILVTKS